MHSALTELFETQAVISRRAHPTLATRIDRAVREGSLSAVLPGAYARTETATQWCTIAAGVRLWDRDAVIVGEAAAALTFWPQLRVGSVDVITSRQLRSLPSRTGPVLRLHRGAIPRELVMTQHGMRHATAALAAIQLIPTYQADVIDIALRSRKVRIENLNRVIDLMPRRAGNAARRRALIESRSEAWSALERLAHRLLHEAGIDGWRANVPVLVGEDEYVLDVLMNGMPLALEFDGYDAHTRRDTFESDRLRHNTLQLAGFDVLHFTWRMLTEQSAYLTRTVRAAMDVVTRLWQ